MNESHLDRRLAAIEGTLASMHTALSNHLARSEQVERSVGEHETILRGPASNGDRPGITTRVTSLEQSRATGRRVVGWMAGVLAALAGAVVELFCRR